MTTTGTYGNLLSFDAELLLGVLALLDPSQLKLTLGQLRSDVLALALTLGLTQTQIGEMGLKRTHRRLRRLGASQQSGVAEPGTTGTALGERVALLFRREAPTRRLISLWHHPYRVCVPPDAYSCSRIRHAMRDCSDHSSIKPGEAVCEKRPPDSEKEARAAS